MTNKDTEGPAPYPPLIIAWCSVCHKWIAYRAGTESTCCYCDTDLEEG